MSRRHFLLWGLGAFALLGAALGALRRRVQSLIERLSLADVALDTAAPVGRLTDAEIDVLLALGTVVLPTTRSPVATVDLARRHFETRSAGVPGYLDQYRRAIELLQRTAQGVYGTGVRFEALPLANRDRVLRVLLRPYRSTGRLGRYADAVLAPRTGVALRQFVVRDLLVAYYQSGYGWQVVGYEHYPGVPAPEPFAYTRALERGAATSATGRDT